MQTDTQEEVQSTTTSVPPMPNWLMVIFKIYALLILVSVITAAIKLSVSIVSQLVEFSRVIWLTPLSSTGFLVAVFYTTVAVVIALVAAYSLGLFGLKRWCLPILFFTVISLSLVTLLNLLLNNFADSVEFVGRILTLVVTIGIGYSAWRYRAAFLGPTRRLSLQIPLILVLLPIALISILGQIYTDDEAIVDNDLLLPTVAILSEADNAQLALPTIDSLTLSDRAVFDQVHEYHRMLSIGKDIDISAANAAIGSLTEIIDQFLEASRKPGYQCPASVNVHRSDAVLCNLSGIRSVARVVALRSYLEAVEGDTMAALESASAVARVGKLLSRDQPLFIEHLVGIAATNIGVESIGRVVNQATSPLSAETTSSLVRELESYKHDGSALENSLKREYMTTKSALQPSEQFGGYAFHYNSTINELAEMARTNIGVARTPCGLDLELKIHMVETRISEKNKNPMWWALFKPNGIGAIMKNILVASLSNSREKECKANELIETIQRSLRGVTSSQ